MNKTVVALALSTLLRYLFVRWRFQNEKHYTLEVGFDLSRRHFVVKLRLSKFSRIDADF